MTRLQQPIPLSHGAATKEAQSVAAPLLVAAALSLAGVVAAASGKTFRWPGPTLLLLVTASLLLVAGIQLHYYARRFLYSRADIEDWHQADIREQVNEYELLCDWQGDDHRTWSRFSNKSIHCFNIGTLMLGFGVASALVPPEAGRQAGWRVAAACLVLICVLADVAWTAVLYLRDGDLQQRRMEELNELPREKKELT